LFVETTAAVTKPSRTGTRGYIQP